MLSDEKKRHRYDNGLDIEEGGMSGAGMHMDPNQIFSMFFSGGQGGGGGGFGGFGGGGGGGRGGGQGGFGGFPGASFSFG